MRRPILALEIGKEQVALARFRRVRRGSPALALEQVVSSPLVFEAEAPASAWDQLTFFLQGARVQLGLAASARTVAVSLSPYFALTKTINTPAVTNARRAKIVQFEASQAIPFPLEEMCWDWHVMGEHSDGLEVSVAAVKADVIRALLAATGPAGFDVSRIVPSPVALREAFGARRSDPGDPALVVCIGTSTTQLLYLTGDRYATRCLGFGWTDSGMAAASGDSGDRLAQRLVSEIGRTLVHFQQQFSITEPAAIHLCGNGPLAPVRSSLASGLATDVRVFDPVGGAAAHAGDGNRTDVDRATLCSLAGAAAAAAANLPDGECLNLVPGDVQASRRFGQRQPALVFAAGFAALALVPPVVHLSQEQRALRRELQHCETEQRRLEAARQRGVTHTARLASAQQEAELLSRLEKLRAAWPSLLAELEIRLKSAGDMWLDELAIVPSNPSSSARPEATAGARPAIEISGRVVERHGSSDTTFPGKPSAQVKRLLSGLRASPFVAAVHHERFEPAGRGLLRFAMVLTLNPDHVLLARHDG